jgi:predicted anti-sigma-YlaC factor YlaD
MDEGSMMDCRRFRGLAGRMIDGEAGSAEAGAFERHLGACPGCERYYAGLRALAALHAGLREIEPPAGMTDRIVAASRAKARPASGAAWRVAVAAAAGAVVLLGIYAGSIISRSYLEAPAPTYAEVTGLEYLDDYPPASLGEAIEVAAGGAEDE